VPAEVLGAGDAGDVARLEHVDIDLSSRVLADAEQARSDTLWGACRGGLARRRLRMGEASRGPGHEGDLGTAEGAVNEGILRVVGGLEHVVAHAAERQAQVETWRRDVLDEGAGIGAVGPFAVGGRRSGLGGKGDQRIGGEIVHLGEPTADPAGGERPLHGAHKGVFAAGIENDEAQTLGKLEDADDTVERNRLVLHVDVALQRGIDRDEVVDAADLDAMPGVVDDGDTRIAHPVGEVAQGTAHARRIEIAFSLDQLEAGGAQCRLHGVSIARGVGKLGDVGVGAVADDQRYATLRVRRAGHQQRQRSNDHRQFHRSPHPRCAVAALAQAPRGLSAR
jgi:hypothetical protein